MSDILEIIKIYGDSSCAEVYNVLYMNGKTSKSESDTISSIIYKMVAEGILQVHETKKGPKGGKIYTLGKKTSN